MLIVIELFKDGPNIFKTSAAAIDYTHADINDKPDDLLDVKILTTTSEAKACYERGAGIFDCHGLVGRKAWSEFEKFLQDQNIIPKPISHGKPFKPKRRKRPHETLER